MSSRQDLDGDDDFSDIYKAYTGPMGSSAATQKDKTTSVKRTHSDLDEEELEGRDPNAVPTDFTSREAKVWEAKSKATERNWKKRKEEEMICKICGESGHFTQGCPSTLGANRKSQDFFERVPAKDPHVKSIFTHEVVQKIEKDVGCKLKIEEKFIIVSGKDRLILKKGVDAVHKFKDDAAGKCFHNSLDEPDSKGYSSSPATHPRSFGHRSPAASRLGQFDSKTSNRSPHGSAYYSNRSSRPEKVVEDSGFDNLLILPSGSPCAHNSDGGKLRSSHSKSPARSSYAGNSYNLYEGHAQGRGGFRSDGYDDAGGSKIPLSQSFDYPRTLEDLELHYKKEAMELTKIREKEEDNEISRHREAVKEMRQDYLEKVAMMEAAHSSMWQEFLHLESQRKQNFLKPISALEFGGYERSSHSELKNESSKFNHSGSSIHSRITYPTTMNTYPSRLHDSYHDFNRHDSGKSFNRY